MASLTLTAAEAVVRFLAAQETEIDGRALPLFGGVWAIFGHGNVAGLGPALEARRGKLPVFRAHNAQAMALAAIAYAKTHARRRMMACTSSIGPGATNVVTAAALAHVNRLPVLIIPGDVFANRAPDPVLQQIEDWGDGTVSANDAFKPVSRYFDRITRPEQILTALPRALRVMQEALVQAGYGVMNHGYPSTKEPIAELVASLVHYQRAHTRRVSFEWAMIDGVNDRDVDADRLAEIARPLRAHVNLIPLNRTPEWPTQGSTPERVAAFRERLVRLGVNATTRANRGTDIDAACGQLRASTATTSAPSTSTVVDAPIRMARRNDSTAGTD